MRRRRIFVWNVNISLRFQISNEWKQALIWMCWKQKLGFRPFDTIELISGGVFVLFIFSFDMAKPIRAQAKQNNTKIITYWSNGLVYWNVCMRTDIVHDISRYGFPPIRTEIGLPTSLKTRCNNACVSVFKCTGWIQNYMLHDKANDFIFTIT